MGWRGFVSINDNKWGMLGLGIGELGEVKGLLGKFGEEKID